MKLAIVVQRYGADINGGAELHARYIAERMQRHADVTVLTSCARDYVTWRNEFPEGLETVNGVAVRRFPVTHERDVHLFGRRSSQVFREHHSIRDELAWLDAEGPASHALVRYIQSSRAAYDYYFFFSFRYYHAYHGARAAMERAVLVPTAERDEAVGLAVFGPVFRGVRALMYNSPEEQRLIQSAAANERVPGVVVGVGSEIPGGPQPARFRQKYGIHERFALYIGRIDQNKGCGELFSFFLSALPALPRGFTLALIGKPLLAIPEHPRIRHLGFVDEQDKYDALAAADLLIMPSYYESLSMVALEAWALGKPVLANGACEVLRGQCIRSRAGLYYDNRAEFVETLRAMTGGRGLSGALGSHGREFFERNYAWPVIERKYLDMLHRLDAQTQERRVAEALPGWFARRRRTVPPAADVLARLPSGPVLDRTEHPHAAVS